MLKNIWLPNHILYFKFQFLCNNGNKWPFYLEICHIRSFFNLAKLQCKQTVARYNWLHSFSCAARWFKRQISCHNKRCIQLSQSQPCTGKVQTCHEYWNLYVTMLWSYRVVESSGCKHGLGGKRRSLLWQKHQTSSKISINRLIKVDEKMSVSNIIHVSYIRS